GREAQYRTERYYRLSAAARGRPAGGTLKRREKARTSLTLEIFDDLRQYIDACKKVTEWREIRGADWNLEIGAIIEAAAERITQPPLLIFDEIKGYPAGFRVLGLSFANYRRGALAPGPFPPKSKSGVI